MKRIEVFDPPMCCSSGVCGASVDPRLVEFAAALDWLRSRQVAVTRHNPTHDFSAFADNPTVSSEIDERGVECLPLVLVDGVIACRGRYPQRNELCTMLGLTADEGTSH